MLHANKGFKIKTSLWWGQFAVKKLSYHMIPPNMCVLRSHQLRIVYRRSVYGFWWNPRGNIFWHFPQKMKMRERSFQVFFFFYSFLLKRSSIKYTLWASHHLACENTVFIYSCHDEWILQFVPLYISHTISCWCASANTSPKMRLNAPFLSLSAPLVPQHGQFPLC